MSLFCCISMAAQLPVLIQQKWNDATTAETLKRDFKLWRQKGVTGVCFDAGTDCDRIALAQDWNITPGYRRWRRKDCLGNGTR